MTAAISSRHAAARTRPARAELTFLRLVPGDSPVHRLWAGTKLIVAAELALVGFDRAHVVHARRARRRRADRAARRAHPARRVPAPAARLSISCCCSGSLLNSLSTTPPVVHLGPLPVSLGALGDAIAVPRARDRAGHVGRARRVDDAARRGRARARAARHARCACSGSRSTSGSSRSGSRCGACRCSSTRCARWPRPGGSVITTGAPASTSRAGAVIELHDLVSTAIIVSLRRAHDLADAITARGGIGAIGEHARRRVRLARRGRAARA